jgi:nucleoid-associated protein YgaU
VTTQRLPTTQGYDLFKAAVTFLLLLAVLLAVAFNSGSTQAAEEEPVPTLIPAVIPPTIGDSAVVAGCIQLSGTGTAGADTQIRSDDNILGSVTVGEDGTWSITTCVDPGNFHIVAVTVNEVGAEVNRSAGLVVLVPAPTAVPTPIQDDAEAVQPTPEATEVSGDGQDYIVEQGDWLMGLSREFYGDASRAEDIFNATNAKAAEDSSYATITNPNILEVGWKIWLPLP